VERVTAVARMRVEDPVSAIQQEQDDMRNAEKAGLTTTKPEQKFEEMLNAIGDSLSDLASSDNGEDGEDEDDDEEDSAGGNLSKDDQPGWVMGTISKTVQYRMERLFVCLFVIILHSPPKGDAQLSYHKLANHWWSWHFNPHPWNCLGLKPGGHKAVETPNLPPRQSRPSRMECFRQKQMKLDELTQPCWRDAADYFCDRDKKYGTTELKIQAVIQTQTADDAASSVLTTFSKPQETLNRVTGELQMPQVTSRPGSSHMCLG